jgi:hypothetical protein
MLPRRGIPAFVSAHPTRTGPVESATALVAGIPPDSIEVDVSTKLLQGDAELIDVVRAASQEATIAATWSFATDAVPISVELAGIARVTTVNRSGTSGTYRGAVGVRNRAGGRRRGGCELRRR